jgi:Secretion system C-terminal sorting domain
MLTITHILPIKNSLIFKLTIMKKVLVIKTFITALCLSALMNASLAQNPNSDADPAITSFSFAASPIVVNNTTVLTVFFTNAGFVNTIPAGTVGLKISLPTSAEYAGFPESVVSLSGTFLSKFNWTYNPAVKSYFGTSNQAIIAGDGGTVIVTIKGLIPTAALNSVANIQRLAPIWYPNEDVTNNNLTAALGVVPGGPVPIKLLSFNATKQSKVVDLNWQTSTEVNSSYFDVQFSKNGADWSSIGIVNAAGNSNTTKSYSLVHRSPVNSINYYRLKQVDSDGKYENSLIRTVKFKSDNSVTIMPNPTTDRLFITSNTPGRLQSLTMISDEGQQVYSVTNFVLGNSIDMRSYAPGIYILKIVDKEGNTETMKVIKQ